MPIASTNLSAENHVATSNPLISPLLLLYVNQSINAQYALIHQHSLQEKGYIMNAKI